jgi:hypothetical protein
MKQSYKQAIGLDVPQPGVPEGYKPLTTPTTGTDWVTTEDPETAKESKADPLDKSMKIQLIVPLLIGDHNYAKGDILDLEIPQDRKKYLVEHKLADWYDPKAKPETKEDAKPVVAPHDLPLDPHVEVATVKVPSNAAKHK